MYEIFGHIGPTYKTLSQYCRPRKTTAREDRRFKVMKFGTFQDCPTFICPVDLMPLFVRDV